MYGHILRLDYEDLDSVNLLVTIDCSKGVRKVYLLKDRLVKKSCGPESLKLDLESSQNLIVHNLKTIYTRPQKSKGCLAIPSKGPQKSVKGAIKAGKEKDLKDVRLGLIKLSQR